jgi:16S rRNA U1498 N3-methylase RsmE
MTAKQTDSSTPFPKSGKEETEAMLGMQKELLEACEQASRAWLARVKSEVDLWSELAAKLTKTRSAPEALSAYQECVAQRMQMAAEDWQRLSDDYQRIMQTISQSPVNGRPLGST